MRSRSTIETVVCLSLGLALPSVAQTSSSFSGPQISYPSVVLLDSRGTDTLDFDQASSLTFGSAPPTICNVGDPDNKTSTQNPSIDLGCFCSEVVGLAPQVQYQPAPRSSTEQPPVGGGRDENSKPAAALIAQPHERSDRNLDIYYRNRREFSLDVGWHPVNIPFIYDFAVGDSYNMTPLKYTLVPIVASLRWHVTNVGWKWIFRGNMDFTFSGSITAIPRGPETHYYSFDFGIRRNFVYRNWKVVPFFEQRGGAGIINAKEPLGVQFAQGQNLTFTYNLGVGARYNLNSKYSFSAGMNYMHISNGYLSEPQFTNYGINVYGPMFGMDVRLGKPRGVSQ
jgi:hypothetical protein